VASLRLMLKNGAYIVEILEMKLIEDGMLSCAKLNNFFLFFLGVGNEPCFFCG